MRTKLLRGASDSSDPNVTGNIASLALSASFNVCFDLGVDWDYFDQVAIFAYIFGPSSGATGVQLFGSDTAIGDTNLKPETDEKQGARRLGFQYGGATPPLNMSYPTIAGAGSMVVKPWGRYLIVTGTNGDAVNAFGPNSFIAFCAYPRSTTTQ